ncbi:MAG TPA: tetratricopeptide repeat protein [Vicinamibacterales bacterium]|nr:tetratricopeptide repeat protein [Vicinamibacterales bacterium]
MVALLIRVTVAVSVADLPLVRTPKLDAFEYVSWARRLALGDFVWPSVSAHGPGYPLFLAAVFALGGSIRAALFVQCVLGATTSLFIAMLGRRWFGVGAGVCAGLIYATFGPVVFIETAVLSEGLLLFLLVAALVLLSADDLGPRRAAGAGLLLGMAILVRATAVLVEMAFIIALWRAGSARRRAVIGALVISAGIVVAPAMTKNWVDAGTFSTQGFGGLNVYIGNSPLHGGKAEFRLGAGWDALNSLARRSGADDPGAQDRYYVRKTVDEIRIHPIAYARLLAEKTLWLVQADEVRDSHSFYFFADQSAALAVLPRMAILVPLAALGCAALVRRRQRPPALLIAYTLGAAFSVVAFVMGTRYRIVIVPSLAIAAGVGVLSTFDAIRQRQRPALVRAGVFALAAIVVSHVLTDARSHNPGEEWAFTGASLVTEHRLPEAEAAYRDALTAEPDSAFASDGLGLTLFDGQRWAVARVQIERATRLDPDNSQAAYHLGLLDDHDDRLEQAFADYRRSLAIDPTNLDAMRHLASVLVRLRRDQDAIVVLQKLVAHAPDDAEAHRALAGALGGTGRLAEAERELTLTTGLNPENGEAWLDRCLVSLDLGQTSDAVTACQRATELGVSSDRMKLARAAIAARLAAPRR